MAGCYQCVTNAPIRVPAALVVVDAQKGFDDAKWGPRNNPNAELCIAGLIGRWRAKGWPIIHVAHDSTEPTSPLRPGQPGNQFKPEAIPVSGETIYRKSVNSAFIGTTMEEDLRTWGIGALVLIGFTTNHCISTTARMAGNFGFRTYVVSDATVTFDRPGLDGIIRPAHEVHVSALSDLNGEFALVINAATACALVGAVQG
jgi:nicotinamidase-related amidase